ncbi:MAG: hypothetical protein LBQ66_02585 [Planctomycetaceae bacterium]|jgi:flagellar motor switch protein FliG|nr:hypothetical protein [Planctomycetaceae bacterium]
MNGIRKTALLLSGLEWQTVDLLLGRLDSESARAVRREMMSLGSVSVQETHRLANEFLHRAGRKQRKSVAVMEHQLANGEIDLPLRHSDKNVRFDVDAFIPSNRPFDFLRYAETDDIVRELAGEYPQTVAVVLAYLPASRAGEILGCLPTALQNEVTKRLAGFEKADEQILHEIELSLRERLERRRDSETRRTKGNAVLQKILETSRTQEKNKRPERNYEQKTTEERRFSFDDLEHLDNSQLSTLFHSVDMMTAMLALVGANPSLIERVTKRFSPTEEYQMKQQLKRLGSINEEDVIRARNTVLELVNN